MKYRNYILLFIANGFFSPLWYQAITAGGDGYFRFILASSVALSAILSYVLAKHIEKNTKFFFTISVILLSVFILILNNPISQILASVAICIAALAVQMDVSKCYQAIGFGKLSMASQISFGICVVLGIFLPPISLPYISVAALLLALI
jgi:hypothetical protein